MWEDLLRARSLELVQPTYGGSRGGPAKPVPPVTKPGPAQLDAAEAVLGVALPGSYRAFCMELGPGALRDWIRVYAPCAETSHYDLVAYGRDWREFDDSHRQGESWWRPYSFPVNDLVTFADTMTGDVFGFYPKEPTAGDEFAVYRIPREPDPGPVVELERVADSFPGFLEAEAFHDRMADAPLTWEPFGWKRP
jgi:SMI1 / KNR4 family (SUKH-1)